MEHSVETWVNQQNIKRLREQLDANGLQRTTLVGLLAEEEAKAAEAKNRETAGLTPDAT